MPTLTATFRLVDRYSEQLNKIMKATDMAVQNMLSASKAADGMNTSAAAVGSGFEESSEKALKFADSLREITSAKGAALNWQGKPDFELPDGKSKGKDGAAAADSASDAGKAADGAGKKVGGLTGSVNKLNTKVTKVKENFKKLFGSVVNAGNLQKGLQMTDAYMNTFVKLNRINDGGQTDGALQDKVFAAANRSRGSFSGMAEAVAAMSRGSGGLFSGNDETIRFTELLQKSMKLSGLGEEDQKSVFQQVAQAVSSGGLSGENLSSIMSSAPAVTDALGSYLGKTGAELKAMAAQGGITADVIKEAMFAAEGDIEERFSGLPMSFADASGMISNNLQQAFAPVMQKITEVLNSEGVRNVLGMLTEGIRWAAGGFEQLIGAFQRGDPVVKAFFATAVLMAAVWAAGMAISAVASLAAAWPLVLIVGILAAIILGLNQMGMSFADIFGGIGGIVGGFYAVVYNIIAGIWNLFVSVAEFIANVFNDPIGAIVNLFVNMATSVMGVLKSIAKAIDDLFGSNFAGAIGEKMDALQAWGDSVKKDDYKSLDDMRMETKDIMDTSSDWGAKGSEIGGLMDGWDLGGSMEEMMGKLGGGLGGGPGSDLGTQSNPVTVQGTGQNGSMDVNMEDEDIQYLRDLAQRDYIARIANNTLAPNIRVEFTGQISRDVDLSALGSGVGEILRNELDAAPEGGY